jgi:hypothetical protein
MLMPITKDLDQYVDSKLLLSGIILSYPEYGIPVFRHAVFAYKPTFFGKYRRYSLLNRGLSIKQDDLEEQPTLLLARASFPRFPDILSVLSTNMYNKNRGN